MDGDEKRHSRQHEWRKHGPKRARLGDVLKDLQAAALDQIAQQVPEQVPEEPANETDELEVEDLAQPPFALGGNVGEEQNQAALQEGEQAQAQPGLDDGSNQQFEGNSVNQEDQLDASSSQEQNETFDGFDSDDSSICDMELHFMDEGELETEDCEDSGDTEDPEDPDDPHVRESSEESADSDLENEELQNFDFSSAVLDQPVLMRAIPTVREFLYLDLALMIRHKNTYESLIGSFEAKNALFGKKYLPTSKKELWRILGQNKAGIVEHVYCPECCGYIGKKKKLGMIARCPNDLCDYSVETRKAKYFVTLSLRSQFKKFLETPGVPDLLKYRETRVKHRDGAIEDVFDSQNYKDMNLGPNDFSGVLNTDGCKIRKGAKLEIYPVFFRLNELPPLLRQKYMFLAAVFVDTREPKMNCLLQPVVEQLNSLSESGITWSPNGSGRDHVVSKIKTQCFCVDGKARHQILNMSSHQSRYGCTYCTIRGVLVGESLTMRWPSLPNPEVPAFEDRSHDGMIQSMLQAHESNQPVLGHKGVSSLMLLNGFNLRKGNACDDLHNLYECAAKHITDLTLTVAPRVKETMGQETLCRIIDNRMRKIKTPANISRKPGTCSLMNRKQFTGTEWRNWIMYYAVICLKGLIVEEYITPVALLSRGSFLLSQDIILPEHMVEADDCFRRFLELNETLYGIENTKLNLHSLTHFAKSVLENGNLWCYTTFNFESWNHKIMKSVLSPKGALLQIVVRHMILLCLQLAQHSEENISQAVRAQLRRILGKKRLIRAQEISEHVYLKQMTTIRNATDHEQQILQSCGFQGVQLLKEYKKISVNSTDYYPRKYSEDSSKSDNSVVYTYKDTFCSIESVVSFHTGLREESGLFVLEHSVTNHPHFPDASHLTCLLDPRHGVGFFLRPEEIRSPVVQMPLHGEMYIVPLANLFEID